ncbi:MAG: YggS family pyridoxal phosphate-dependent enzyme [Thermoleophilia bacterium]
MAQRAIYEHLDPEKIRANLERAWQQIDAACARSGRDPADVELLVATKYVAPGAMPALAEAGVTLVGENRAQDLAEKFALCGELFTWDFIGHLQSNKVRRILPVARLIHAVDSLSTVAEIHRRAPGATDVLLQVNIGQETGKYGIIQAEVDRFLEEATRYSRVNFTGLMTMPPLAADPGDVRPIFAQLRILAADLSRKWLGTYHFKNLSMGTSNDYLIAVEEGATTVRLGGVLFM